SPHRRQIRTFFLSSRRRCPIRTPRSHLLQMSITFEICSFPSRSIIPPCCICRVGRVCRLIILTRSTVKRPSCGKTRKTLPCLPRSLPVITLTKSSFLMCPDACGTSFVCAIQLFPYYFCC